MTKEYMKFEQGFIKGAEALGVDSAFMQGYLKYAQDVTDTWIPYVNAAAKLSGDPDYKVKLAADIILMGRKDALEKCAGLGDSLGNINWMGMLDQLGGHLGGSSGLGGLLAGGGGGALIGLLLSKALGIPPHLGLLLGGALGGGAGYGFGSGSFGQMPAAHQQELNGTAVPNQGQQGMDAPSMSQHTPEGVPQQGGDPEGAVKSIAPTQPGQVVAPPGQSATSQHSPTLVPPPAPRPQPAGMQAAPITKPPMPPTPPGMHLGGGNNSMNPLAAPKPMQNAPMLGKKANCVSVNAALADKIANGPVSIAQEPQINSVPQPLPNQQPQPRQQDPNDVSHESIALLQHLLSSEQYNQQAAAGGQHVTPSQISVGQPYNKDQGALNRLKDMGAQNPESLMNPPDIKPKFNISEAFGNSHGPQQFVNSSPGAPTTSKPMQAAKPGPLGFPGSNVAQGFSAHQKSTAQALKASV